MGRTSKVGSIHQLHANVAFSQDADHPVLDEEHLFSDGALSDDVVSGLEDLESQFGQHGRHKVGIGVGKQRHGGHQLTAVEVYDFLDGDRKKIDSLFCLLELENCHGPMILRVDLI